MQCRLAGWGWQLWPPTAIREIFEIKRDKKPQNLRKAFLVQYMTCLKNRPNNLYFPKLRPNSLNFLSDSGEHCIPLLLLLPRHLTFCCPLCTFLRAQNSAEPTVLDTLTERKLRFGVLVLFLLLILPLCMALESWYRFWNVESGHGWDELVNRGQEKQSIIHDEYNLSCCYHHNVVGMQLHVSRHTSHSSFRLTFSLCSTFWILFLLLFLLAWLRLLLIIDFFFP